MLIHNHLMQPLLLAKIMYTMLSRSWLSYLIRPRRYLAFEITPCSMPFLRYLKMFYYLQSIAPMLNQQGPLCSEYLMPTRPQPRKSHYHLLELRNSQHLCRYQLIMNSLLMSQHLFHHWPLVMCLSLNLLNRYWLLTNKFPQQFCEQNRSLPRLISLVIQYLLQH